MASHVFYLQLQLLLVPLLSTLCAQSLSNVPEHALSDILP